MEAFLILQILFDAVLLFGILFLFHFSVHQTQKKKEESDILNGFQVQEIRENLQELLMTLKQLGKEVSDNIQEKVIEAETKIENFKKVISKFQKDLAKVTKISEELNNERTRLEEKSDAIEAAKKNLPKALPSAENSSLALSALELDKVDVGLKKQDLNPSLDFALKASGKNMGISSGLVKEVYRLTDMKLEVNEIMRRTKLSRAEVQLILNLRGNRFATPN